MMRFLRTDGSPGRSIWRALGQHDAEALLFPVADDDDLDLVAGLPVADGGDHAGDAIRRRFVHGDHDVPGLQPGFRGRRILRDLA